MKNVSRHDEAQTKKDSRHPYEPPSIIYKGKISTRAGSPLGNENVSGGGSTVADPADLFGND